LTFESSEPPLVPDALADKSALPEDDDISLPVPGLLDAESVDPPPNPESLELPSDFGNPDESDMGGAESDLLLALLASGSDELPLGEDKGSEADLLDADGSVGDVLLAPGSVDDAPAIGGLDALDPFSSDDDDVLDPLSSDVDDLLADKPEDAALEGSVPFAPVVGDVVGEPNELAPAVPDALSSADVADFAPAPLELVVADAAPGAFSSDDALVDGPLDAPAAVGATPPAPGNARLRSIAGLWEAETE